jgi:predicted extracellular nuclease
MKNIVFFAIISMLFSCSAGKQNITNDGNDKELTVMFYNVENLFDTADDPLTDDEEFTPGGKNAWTKERYSKKVGDLAKVIASVDAELPEIVGLCEVENRMVVDDLFASQALTSGKYEIIHRESPDGRGIDCALAYRPDAILFDKQLFYRPTLPAGDRPDTRLLLYARGIKGKDTLHVFVNHWPSRSGGQEATEPKRMALATLVREKVDSIIQTSADARILLMGDFNDYPDNKSIREVLQASGSQDGFMFNFMDEFQRKGEGTYYYKGEWGCLDQFITSGSMVKSGSGITAPTGSAKIFQEEWLLYTSSDGKVAPNRTFGHEYFGGYSDHLPIVLQMQVK